MARPVARPPRYVMGVLDVKGLGSDNGGPMRHLARVVIMLSVLLAPLWMCAWAREARAADRIEAALDVAEGRGAHSGPSDPMAGADEDAGVVEDDDSSSGECAAPPAWARLDRHHRGPLRFAVRVGAAPPRVHLEAETPPPRP